LTANPYAVTFTLWPGILKFEFGSGTFQRDKFVFVQARRTMRPGFMAPFSGSLNGKRFPISSWRAVPKTPQNALVVFGTALPPGKLCQKLQPHRIGDAAQMSDTALLTRTARITIEIY
jgi:hypothetical protein